MSERRYYNYGSTARQMEPLRRSPEPRRPEPQRPERRERPQIDTQTRKNRERQEVMNGSYVLFLAVIALILGIAFVYYLSLESSIASRSSNITSLQIEISNLKMENDAALDAIEDSVDLNTVKVQAEQLGMVYISSSQVVEYQSPTADYVIQYEEIPESGVLAQSDSVTQ